MTTFSRAINLYIDVDRIGGKPCLLDGTGSTRLQASPEWMEDDVFPLRLWFRKRGSALTAAISVRFSAADNLVIAGKLASDLATEDLLFSATGFTEKQEGDEYYYESTVNLETSEIDTAFAATSETSLNVKVDIESQDALNDGRSSFRFDLVINKQVYGGEGDPTPGTPAYPHPSTLLVNLSGSEDVPAGDNSVEVTGLGLPSAPALVLVSVQRPTISAPMVFGNLLQGSSSTDGFTYHLSAPTDRSGYKIDYLIIL